MQHTSNHPVNSGYGMTDRQLKLRELTDVSISKERVGGKRILLIDFRKVQRLVLNNTVTFWISWMRKFVKKDLVYTTKKLHLILFIRFGSSDLLFPKLKKFLPGKCFTSNDKAIPAVDVILQRFRNHIF